MGKVELLAPAGSYESLIGALHAGADAIYLGGEKFGARAFAENFTTETLCHGIKYAHALGKKIFLTVNTLVKEKEFDEIYDYIYPFYKAGLDAVIVQDLGVFQFIKRHFPDMELHVSTQMTITGTYGAKLLKEMGAHRIVPARELSLNEIKDIKQETGLDIETFVHGAMCYCYSGQCLFSSYLGGRSGNRGKCAQPCRLPYEIVHKQKGNIKGISYPLSLKDMCTIEHLPQLIEAGIDSFKIEGRMKKPEYVAGVTEIYRKYIDLYYADPHSYKVDQSDMDKLRALYIRSEILDGYYFRHNGREMITLTSPSYSGSDEQLLISIRKKYLEKEPKVKISMEANFSLGEKAKLTVSANGFQVTAFGEVVQPALKAPITKENIQKGLLGLGDSFYACDSLTLIMDEQIFYSLKAIKELRREAITMLTDKLCPNRDDARLERNDIQDNTSKEKTVIDETAECRLLISKNEQMEAYLESDIEVSHLIIESHLLKEQSLDDQLKEFKNQILRRKSRIPKLLIALPYILRKRDYSWLSNLTSKLSFRDIDGVLVRNLETYAFLKENNYKGLLYGDAGFYCWNTESVQYLNEFTGLCLPLELSKKEQAPLLSTHRGFEQIVYGHMPMMVTANCIAKTSNQCLKTVGKSDSLKEQYDYSLVDRMNKRLPVHTNCKHCYNVIYNPVVLSLHDKVKAGMQIGKRLNLTVETKEEAKKVLDYFWAIEIGTVSKEKDIPFADYTTGHEKKGAL
ncbi:MAG: U32 family peptidase [Lachnospiraceae bacterium]|nr:U32 family peptidase [Lachnospiraceae bacterium]